MRLKFPWFLQCQLLWISFCGRESRYFTHLQWPLACASKECEHVDYNMWPLPCATSDSKSCFTFCKKGNFPLSTPVDVRFPVSPVNVRSVNHYSAVGPPKRLFSSSLSDRKWMKISPSMHLFLNFGVVRVGVFKYITRGHLNNYTPHALWVLG